MTIKELQRILEQGCIHESNTAHLTVICKTCAADLILGLEELRLTMDSIRQKQKTELENAY